MRPSATISAGRSRSMDFPLKRMAPRRGRTTPEMVRLIVDLPAPFAPSTVTISPPCTSKSTPRRISAAPYPAYRPLTASNGSGTAHIRLHPARRPVTQIGFDDTRIGRDLGRRPFSDDAAFGNNEDMLG